MSEVARSWLPAEAFTVSAVKAVLAVAVAPWSDAWFARREVAVSAVRHGGIQKVREQRLEAKGSVATAHLPGPGKRLLLEAALDTDLAQKELCESDHRVLDAFAGVILEDLVARLDAALTDGDGTRGDSIDVTLTIGDRELVTVLLPSNALVPALKARYGAPRRAQVKPANRFAALGPTEIVVEGVLGQAEIGMHDFRELAVGDVLVLDRSLREPVELRVAQHRGTLGFGKLTRREGRVAVQF